jgi:DNA-directed RNA polymerase subunit K/omega
MPLKLVISPHDMALEGTPVSLNIETIVADAPGTDESENDSDIEAVSGEDGENDDSDADSAGIGSDSDADSAGSGSDSDEHETAGGIDDDNGTSPPPVSKPSARATSNVVPTDLTNLPGELQELAEHLAPGADVDSSDDEDWGDRLQQSGLLGDNGVPGEALLFEHPEAAMANVDEVRAAAKIIRDSSGTIIDPYHTTTPIITRYEYAKVIGQRAEQIAVGGMTAIDVPHPGMSARDIAVAEYNAKAIPFIIRRPLPSGKSEYWRVSDLIDVSY